MPGGRRFTPPDPPSPQGPLAPARWLRRRRAWGSERRCALRGAEQTSLAALVRAGGCAWEMPLSLAAAGPSAPLGGQSSPLTAPPRGRQVHGRELLGWALGWTGHPLAC